MSEERRPYTMSEAALQQRRAASKLGAAAATGPKTPEGKAIVSRNGWKTGEYSRIAKAPEWLRLSLAARGKPCLSTCPKYPCSLVEDELTKLGGDCLDKSVYVEAFDSIIRTLQSGNVQHVHGLLAAQVANAIQLMQDLRVAIAEHGPMVPRYAVSKEGVVIEHAGKPVVIGYSINPAFAQFTLLLDRLGINFPALMATPKEVQKLSDDEDAADAITNLFSRVLSRAGDGPVKRGRIIDHDEEGDA